MVRVQRDIANPSTIRLKTINLSRYFCGDLSVNASITVHRYINSPRKEMNVKSLAQTMFGAIGDNFPRIFLYSIGALPSSSGFLGVFERLAGFNPYFRITRATRFLFILSAMATRGDPYPGLSFITASILRRSASSFSGILRW